MPYAINIVRDLLGNDAAYPCNLIIDRSVSVYPLFISSICIFHVDVIINLFSWHLQFGAFFRIKTLFSLHLFSIIQRVFFRALKKSSKLDGSLFFFEIRWEIVFFSR